MKEWIICEYGPNHVQSPFECKPIGLAMEKQMGDPLDADGFILFTEFSSWLTNNNLCAFATSSYGDMKRGKNLSVIYRGE